jgi:hypothetical protein
LNDPIYKLSLDLVDLGFRVSIENFFYLRFHFLELVDNGGSYLASLAVGVLQQSDLVLDVVGVEFGCVGNTLDVVFAFLLILFHHGFKTIDLVESLLAKVFDLALNVLELISGFFVKTSSNALFLG